MLVRAFFRKIIGLLLDRYRPELHYMRGPGPKWLAAHSGSGKKNRVG
ncbi:MAG TPA: hypothetical protein VGF60_13040 [Xanthobacteraceae bacterium]|jgi:hypothetical protein